MRACRPRHLLGWAALSLLLVAASMSAEEGAAPEAEEAADFARRAAFAALHGPQKIFLESIDADGILRRLLGNPVWGGLTGRQQVMLRASAREHFAQALAPVAGSSAQVAWASVPAGTEGPVLVYLGLRYGASSLKTRWTVRHTRRGWTIEDIVLVDPGLSLADEMGRLLGPDPVRRRDTGREARLRALPRLAALGVIAAIVAVFTPRLSRDRRRLLWLVASVPAALCLVDSALAVRRALAEPFALVDTLPAQPWRQFEKRALEEQAAGRGAEAREAWIRCLEAGAPRAPVYYQMGLNARAAGDTDEAIANFERALAQKPPAPGAGRELATIALSRGQYGQARALLESYLRQAGPDPETLATLAVVETDLGDAPDAVQTIERARSLVAEAWRGAELEAEIHARSRNAAATVAALRPLETEGRLDRSTLRADPAYLPIATDPVWVAFLSEPPSAAPQK